MIDDPETLDENDLRFHGHFMMKVYENDVVWIGDVVGEAPTSAYVTLGFKHLELVGDFDVLLDRMRAAVRLLERARENPEQWDLLLPRRSRRGERGPREWPHPFSDRGDHQA